MTPKKITVYKECPFCGGFLVPLLHYSSNHIYHWNCNKRSCQFHDTELRPKTLRLIEMWKSAYEKDVANAD